MNITVSMYYPPSNDVNLSWLTTRASTLDLEVKENDTLANLTSLIEAKCSIPADHITLFVTSYLKGTNTPVRIITDDSSIFEILKLEGSRGHEVRFPAYVKKCEDPNHCPNQNNAPRTLAITTTPETYISLSCGIHTDINNLG